MLSGSKVLVTGATGRLGAALTARLEELGADVIPVVMGGYPDLPKRIPWPARTVPLRVRGDDDLRGLPRPDLAINAHWEVRRDLSRAGQLAFEIDRNIRCLEGFWDWLARAGTRALANISTIKVYGHGHADPISSETEPRPSTPYGIAKLAAEKYLEAVFEGTGTAVLHLRLCSVMTAGGHPSQLVSQLAAGVVERKTVRINAGHLAYLIPIEEAVDLIIQAAAGGRGGRYNIVAPGIPNERVAALFGRIGGREVPAEYVDLEPGVRDPVYLSDIPRLRAPWTRRISLEKAVRNILAFSSRTDPLTAPHSAAARRPSRTPGSRAGSRRGPCRRTSSPRG